MSQTKKKESGFINHASIVINCDPPRQHSHETLTEGGVGQQDVVQLRFTYPPFNKEDHSLLFDLTTSSVSVSIILSLRINQNKKRDRICMRRRIKVSMVPPRASPSHGGDLLGHKGCNQTLAALDTLAALA